MLSEKEMMIMTGGVGGNKRFLLIELWKISERKNEEKEKEVISALLNYIDDQSITRATRKTIEK